MTKIKSIHAEDTLSRDDVREIKVAVMLDNYRESKACFSLDANNNPQQDEQDLKKTIDNINDMVALKLIGMDIENLPKIDNVILEIYNTQSKSVFTAKAIHAVSMAAAKAGAKNSLLPLYLYLMHLEESEDEQMLKIPVPIFNFISGGNDDVRSLDFSEFLVVPASSKRYLESLQIGELVFKSLQKLIELKYLKLDDYNDGYLPDLPTNKDAFSLIQQAILNISSIKLGFDVFLGLDSKASNFFIDKKYSIKDLPNPLSAKQLVEYYKDLNKDVRMLYLEDALENDDWGEWRACFEKFCDTTLIVGGDLVSNRLERLKMAIDKKVINAVAINPEKIGTVTDLLVFARIARKANLKIIISDKADKTDDDSIADLSTAVSADYVKLGSFLKKGNIVKYNRFLQIDNHLKIL